MAAKTNRKPKGRFGPGRNQLLQAQVSRRKRLYNIWILYSGRLGLDLSPKSDAAFFHTVMLEGDESIKTYIPEPPPVITSVGGQASRTQFDARVIPRKGRHKLDEVKDTFDPNDTRERHQFEAQSLIAADTGCEYRRFCRADFEAMSPFLDNWIRACAVIGACRDIVLEPYATELLGYFRPSTRMTLEHLLVPVDPVLGSTYIAAILRAVQEGILSSDLKDKPLCALSEFWLRDDTDA